MRHAGALRTKPQVLTSLMPMKPTVPKGTIKLGKHWIEDANLVHPPTLLKDGNTTVIRPLPLSAPLRKRSPSMKQSFRSSPIEVRAPESKTYVQESRRLSDARLFMPVTSPPPSRVLFASRIVPRFPTQSGMISSSENTSILIESSQPSTQLTEITPRRTRLEILSSPRDHQSQRSMSLPLASGLAPSDDTSKESCSVIRTEETSLPHTRITSSDNSELLETRVPLESSTTIGRSDLILAEETSSCSLTTRSGTISSLPTLLQREQDLKDLLRRQRDLRNEPATTIDQTTSASVSTKADATVEIADTDTPVFADRKNTSIPLATNSPEFLLRNVNDRPRRFRGFLWNQHDTSFLTPSATTSETLRPLPHPPQGSDLAWRTIHENPDLFQITTPIDVNRLEFLLINHPNRPLVSSVLDGFRNGFWPFAEEDENFPDTWDAGNPPLDSRAKEFVSQYALEEELLGRYSRPFGPDLLPGLYSMPIHAVPKANTDKLRLVNNHSASDFSLNNMIPKEDVGMRQDNVQDLCHNLLLFRRTSLEPVWLYKSDVSNAYRLLPMHPLWQIKQIVTINGMRRVDRCCCFGSRGSPDLWCTFMSLVVWIAIHERHIDGSLAYMDDNFGVDTSHTLTLYRPYQCLLPTKQTNLLLLWDELRIPHRQEKQIYGEKITIIGFWVDSVNMLISLPVESTDLLVTSIRSFVHDAPSRRRSLREWQRILGWVNWGLNVQPLLKPALQSCYEKISGRSIAAARIFLNKRTIHDLLWIADMFARHEGVYLLKAITWSPDCADLTIYCDACLSGLGFWSPHEHGTAFACDRPDAPSDVEDNIFWYEALTVLAALEWAVSLSPQPFRVAIFTDNLTTVQMFDSFRAKIPYVDILLAAVEILIDHQVDLRVWHIPGERNIIADALSRQLFSIVAQYIPHLKVNTFQPPRVTSGLRA